MEKNYNGWNNSNSRSSGPGKVKEGEMNKKIEDYLPYYIGQEILVERCSFYMVHVMRILKGEVVKLTYKLAFHLEFAKRAIVKLRLRPLSDMTKEEREIFGWQEDWIFEDKSDPNQPLKTTFLVWEFIDLLKMGFDLFGLIPTGLAVDKTKEVTNATN